MKNNDQGYSHKSGSCEHGHDDTYLPRSWLVAISGAALGSGMLLGNPAAKNTCFAIASLAGGSLVLLAAWMTLRKGKLDMNVLMTVAVAGAWLIDQGNEAAAVVFLFSLSELIESWSLGRARRTIASSLKAVPETALVRTDDGDYMQLPVADVEVGAMIIVRSGARVPMDGKVRGGDSCVDQASITGNSAPVEKKTGDSVFAGTINGEGVLIVEVTNTSDDSTLAKIIKQFEDAEGQKAPTQRFVDSFARIYTPAVFMMAVAVAILPPVLLGAAWTEWFYRALVLLIIACPCALVVATPMSIASGLTVLTRRGVLIKGGAHLEIVGRLEALAVDKTGTITQGEPKVVEIISLTDLDEKDVLFLAAAINQSSGHPLAKAVMEEAEEKGISPYAATNYRSLTGLGVCAEVDGHMYFLGSHKLARELGACSQEVESRLVKIEEAGLSLAILGHMPQIKCKAKSLGIISIGDTIRSEAAEAAAMLHTSGIKRIVMLSGDNQRTVEAISKEAGVDEAFGDLLPRQKIEHLKRLMNEYGFVGIIGDGVNDAPALAHATIRIAMGSTGSDAAIETADVALMENDLTRVADAIRTGRRTLGIIHFNIFFSLATKMVFLIIALWGKMNLWQAIVADTIATMMVIANSLRLLREPSRI